MLEAVDAITHRTHEPLVEYYARIKCNPLATKVKLADVRDRPIGCRSYQRKHRFDS